MDYYNQSSKKVCEALRVNPTLGLSNPQIKSRLALYGPNKLLEKKKINPVLMFLAQFNSFIIYILLFAIIVSVLAGEIVDAVVILIIVVFNAVFGFIQEYKAEKSIEALRKLSGLKSKVIREGREMMIDSEELVPGDILLVEEGTKIPADARIIEAFSLRISEASLTGESVSVNKQDVVISGEKALAERKNMIFSGTVVTGGRAKAIIVSTGMKSEIGKIAGMISAVEKEVTPLQKRLKTLGSRIAIVTLLVCCVVFIAGIIKDGLLQLLLDGQIVEFLLASEQWLLTAVSLAVAAVPEGLPAIVTISLAISVRRMLAKKTLVRKLPSVETLGETTVICTDKTGTLTKNEMTVSKVITNGKEIEVSGNGYGLEGEVKSSRGKLSSNDYLIFKIGSLCNDSSFEVKENNVGIIGDPTEAALIISAKKAGLDYSVLRKEWERKDEIPFDGIRKLMTTVSLDSKSKKKMVFTKGAPEMLLEKCTKVYDNGKVRNFTLSEKNNVLERNKDLAEQALRVIGFAYKPFEKGELENNLIFVGLQAMRDPPHEEVSEAVRVCGEAGIGVIMITGDNAYTAKGIAQEVGIKGDVIEGSEFEKLTREEQIAALKKIRIFARVEPRHKLMVVKLLQEMGHIVSVTGDGVNDAPAIKQANLGISMGISGTDVTKESSEMVIQDDNFATIVTAIEEGRGINQNIKKFVNYLLSSNMAEVMVIFFAIIMSLPLPMTAVMLLWLNLVTDGLPALALSVDPNPKDIMKDKPTRASILGKAMVTNILVMAVLITIGILGLFYWAINHYAYLEEGIFLMKVQTIAFTAMIVMEMVRLQTIRSQYRVKAFSNKWLIMAVVSSILLQLLVIYTPLSQFFGTVPLSILDWSMIVIVAALLFLVNFVVIHVRRKV